MKKIELIKKKKSRGTQSAIETITKKTKKITPKQKRTLQAFSKKNDRDSPKL